MPEASPVWRRAFDAIEQSISPQLEQFVRTDQFADMAAVVARIQGQLQKRAERAMRQAWHFWNLPTGSDVKRVSEQLASLERRVRELSKRLEEQGGSSNGQSAQPERARRAAAP
jgi:hypothetical protein